MGKRICSIPGCGKPHRARGWCFMHYCRWKRNGEPGEAEPRRVQGLPLEDRFWAKVDRTNTCWNWTGALTYGYGRFSLHTKVVQAHRFSYELLVGPIPEGLQLDHLCRNHSCVNPIHLEPVTGRVNVLRGNTIVAEQAARTHCPKGHAYDDANTRIDAKRCRHCRACQRERARLIRQR